MSQHLNRYTIILASMIIALVLFPAARITYTALMMDVPMNDVPTILAHATYGSTYYNARIREILDGYPFMGNPYFIEHQNELAPAFFVADWIAATPMLLGVSYNAGMILNAVLWSLVFVGLVYGIFIQLQFSRLWASLGALLVYTQGYPLMISPVSMQIIFPSFLFFLLSFLIWFHDPLSQKKSWFLIIATTLAFYIYTYLWQIALTMFGLFLISFFIIKKKEIVKRLSIIACMIILFSAPLIIYTVKQLLHPYYWETMARIGLIQTYIPPAAAFYSGIWILCVGILWLVSFFWIESFRADAQFRSHAFFFIVSAMALLIVANSNVITAKELEQSQHVARFMALWLPISLLVYGSFLKRYWHTVRVLALGRRIGITTLIIFGVIGIGWYTKDYWTYRPQGSSAEVITQVQAIQKPLVWLEEHEVEPQVVFIEQPEQINSSLSAMTKHYTVFYNGGMLHLVSDAESAERYLVSSYFRNLTLEDIQKDFQQYAGVGNAIHQHKAHNRKVKICQLLQLHRFGVSCGELTDAVSFKGTEYFNALYELYTKDIQPNINEKLKKFQVRYMLLNKKRGMKEEWDIRMNNISDTQLMYEDENYLIYAINKNTL
ncbi:MAG: hypothetical protein Q8R26_01325 [bacterium]|nr:hypothetical protein [bacterium]